MEIVLQILSYTLFRHKWRFFNVFFLFFLVQVCQQMQFLYKQYRHFKVVQSFESYLRFQHKIMMCLRVL